MRRSAQLLLHFLLAAPLGAQVAVVNPQVRDSGMATTRMAAMLLGQVTTWEDGSTVVLVLADDSEADACVQRLTGRPRERLLRGWKRLVFSGTGIMPLEAADARAALDLVARTPGAVAVLGSAADDPRWRVLPLMVVTP